ncbi:MAG: SRPBCC family protein [Rhodospirillales bacterium]|nr:SRPBCC family protein [Rhodospirillales bacterium]
MKTKPHIPLVDETISINCSISKVFEFISDHENYIRWYPGVMAVTSTDDLPPGTVGKVYNEILRLPSGRRRSFDIQVVESREPGLFATEGTLAPIHPRMEVRLTAKSGNETALNLRFFSRNQSAIGRLLIGTLGPRTIRPQTQSALLKLKSILE